MKHILLIDLNRGFRTELSSRLHDLGYKVTEAHGGVEGMRRYFRQPADAVVVELFMPEKDGLEIIMELKKTSPAMPIIAVAEETVFANLLSIARKLGATGAVMKDVSHGDDIQRICTLLDNQLSGFSEKRQYPRMKVMLPGVLTSLDGRGGSVETEATVRDLSLSGALVSLPGLADRPGLGGPDYILELRDSGSCGGPVSCAGRRQIADGDGLLVGLEFTSMTAETLLHLKYVLS